MNELPIINKQPDELKYGWKIFVFGLLLIIGEMLSIGINIIFLFRFYFFNTNSNNILEFEQIMNISHIFIIISSILILLFLCFLKHRKITILINISYNIIALIICSILTYKDKSFLEYLNVFFIQTLIGWVFLLPILFSVPIYYYDKKYPGFLKQLGKNFGD